MNETDESQRVCVIGLGAMGSALAEAFLAKGHRVTVWNRTVSKCEALAEAGASVATSVPLAIAEAQTVVVCVLDHDVSVSLLLSDDVARALRGKLLVQLSTVTAEESRELGRWAEENGIDYLDGSILTYPAGIRNNEGTIVYSGPKRIFDANQGVLAALGGGPKLVSEVIGGAPTFDKTLYAFHYGSLLAFLHGAAMCHAAGISLETYLDQVGATANQRRYCEMIEKRSYEVTGATMELEAAAYAHVVTLSEELGVDGAFPTMVASHFERAIADGHGQREFAAIFEIMANSRSS